MLTIAYKGEGGLPHAYVSAQSKKNCRKFPNEKL